MKLNVLKQASLPDALTAELARRYHLVELTALTDADFRALAGTFTVLITNGEATVTRELIASLPALELIAVFGVGYDGVDVQAAAEHQVRVSHTPGASGRRAVFRGRKKSPVRGSASWAWGASARPSPGAARGSPCRLLIMTASVSRR